MITKGLLLSAYNLLLQAELVKLSFVERVNVIKTLRYIRPEVENTQGFILEIRKACDGVDENQINKAINDELVKASETKDIPAFSEDTFKHLVESNSGWNAATIMMIEDVFKVSE